MAKIVYNTCHGGFGLSERAVALYAERKGLTLYPEPGRYGLEPTYWLVPAAERTGIIADDQWHSFPIEERAASNRRYDELTLRPRDIARTDPALASAVEELGEAANTRFSNLTVREVPAGSKYRIDEYDGLEWVVTEEEQKWEVAPAEHESAS